MNRKREKLYQQYLDDEKITYIELGKKMDRYRPKKLYRYMRFDEYWKKNIFEGQVFLSPANKVNDPFDCLVYVNHELYANKIYEYVKKIFPNVADKVIREETNAEIAHSLDKRLYKMKNSLRIACFTENCLSPLMWAHYADSHKGFCIEYDLRKLAYGYRWGLLPVIYSNKRYDATKALTVRNSNMAMNPYFFKSSHWKYEKEWRMVVPSNMFEDEEYYADFSDGISAIYLGLESHKEHEDKIREIVKKYSNGSIPIYKIYIKPDSYNLGKDKIN